MHVEVTQALTQEPEHIGRALLAIPENQWYERKSARVAGRELADVEIALANAEGGTIVIGLHDDLIEGLEAHENRVNAQRQAAIDFTEPLVRADAREIECVNSSGALDRLLVIEVELSDGVHHNRRDEVYLRVGDETRRLSFGQRQELMYDKGQSVFDGTTVPNLTVDDLNWESIHEWANTLDALDPERLMRRRGLLREDGVTAAAVLLFGKNPQVSYPNAYVRVLRYRGTERGTGSRQQLLSDQAFDGTIDEVLTQATEAVRDSQPTTRRLASSGRFANMPVIPEGAWVEAIVNAVIHRSYSLGGDHIRVEVFDDRIEVLNAGRFPGLAEASDPREAMRFARNPRIARVCTEQGWAQELGEGIRRMFEEMALFGLPAPSYQQTTGSVRVVLTAISVDPDIAENMPPGWHDIVAALRQAGRLRTGDVEELLGVTRPTAIRRLKEMEHLRVIRWVGKSETDPRAFWTLAE